jgi:hypothetical protein
MLGQSLSPFWALYTNNRQLANTETGKTPNSLNVYRDGAGVMTCRFFARRPPELPACLLVKGYQQAGIPANLRDNGVA